MKAFTFRVALTAAGVIAAGVLGATPALAGGPTVINAHCDDRMVAQPAQLMPNCADQRVTLSGMRWMSWGDGQASGFGTLAGPSGSGPAYVVLDQPRPQMSGQNAFTHATVHTLSGATVQFALSPMWAI